MVVGVGNSFRNDGEEDQACWKETKGCLGLGSLEEVLTTLST